MPRLSIYLIRASLLHFGIGFTIAALILYNKGIPVSPWVWRLLQVHVEMLIFGWMAQLAMGVSFFALPRHTNHAHRYGRVELGWISFILLNLALIIATIGYWQVSQDLIFASRIILLTSVMSYVVMIFPRVKAYGMP